MSVTIYHNPACGTSRNTLAMIRQSGEAPEVIEYLKNPPDRIRLLELIEAMGISVRALLREKGTPYAELGLADPKWSDDQLIDFMLAHPILISRPIVVTDKGVRLCRPVGTGARSARLSRRQFCERGRRSRRANLSATRADALHPNPAINVMPAAQRRAASPWLRHTMRTFPRHAR
jgi:arsenate reductase